MKMLIMIGARPNYPKLISFVKGINYYNDINDNKITYDVVHSNQHYDEMFKDSWVQEMEIKINFHLEIKKFSNRGERINYFISEIINLLTNNSYDYSVCFGDVDSTVAIAIASKFSNLPLIHVEAGLRSGDIDPEEYNRKIITISSTYHLVTSEIAKKNLLNEGIENEKIFFVGNTMTETFLSEIDKRKGRNSTASNTLLFTWHKEYNFSKYQKIYNLMNELSEKYDVVYVYHHSTKKYLKKVELNKNIKILSPQKYQDMIELMLNSKLIVTDSAGLQEESTILGIPCFTLGETTARPETILYGTNTIIGYDANKIISSVKTSIPERWDDKVHIRISEFLEYLNG